MKKLLSDLLFVSMTRVTERKEHTYMHIHTYITKRKKERGREERQKKKKQLSSDVSKDQE